MKNAGPNVLDLLVRAEQRRNADVQRQRARTEAWQIHGFVPHARAPEASHASGAAVATNASKAVPAKRAENGSSETSEVGASVDSESLRLRIDPNSKEGELITAVVDTDRHAFVKMQLVSGQDVLQLEFKTARKTEYLDRGQIRVRRPNELDVMKATVVVSATGERRRVELAPDTQVTLIPASFEVEQRYSQEAFTSLATGTILVRAVAVDDKKMDDEVLELRHKVASKSFRWSKEMSRGYKVDAWTIDILHLDGHCERNPRVVFQERVAAMRLQHRELENVHDECFILDSKATYSTCRLLQFEKANTLPGFNLSPLMWNALTKKFGCLIVPDTYAFASRPYPMGPVGARSGRQALAFARRWCEEATARFANGISCRPQSISSACLELMKSPLEGDWPRVVRDGIRGDENDDVADNFVVRWSPKLYELKPAVLGPVEASTNDDVSSCLGRNLYCAQTTLVIRRQSDDDDDAEIVSLADLQNGQQIATSVDATTGKPTAFRTIHKLTKKTSNTLVVAAPKNGGIAGGNFATGGFALTPESILLNAAPERHEVPLGTLYDDSPDVIRLRERSYRETTNGSRRLCGQTITITVVTSDTLAATQHEALVKARAYAELHGMTFGEYGDHELVTTSKASVRIRRNGDGAVVHKIKVGAKALDPRFVETEEDIPAALDRVKCVSYVLASADFTEKAEKDAEESFRKMVEDHRGAGGDDGENEVAVTGTAKGLGLWFMHGECLTHVPCGPSVDATYRVLPSDAAEFVATANAALNAVLHRGRLSSTDVFHFLGLWLGDGSRSHLTIAVADAEEEQLGPFIERVAQETGSLVRVRTPSDGSACKMYYLTDPRANPLWWFFVHLGCAETKNVGESMLLWLLMSRTRDEALHFVAGLIDADGYTSCENMYGAHVVTLTQGLEKYEHASINAAFAIVTQSLGFDVRYHETFSPEKEIARNEDGTLTRLSASELRATREERWRAKGFKRHHAGRVSISGPMVSRIPLLLLDAKRLKKNARYAEEGLPTAHATHGAVAIRGCSHLSFMRVEKSQATEVVGVEFEPRCSDDGEDGEFFNSFILANGFVALC